MALLWQINDASRLYQIAFIRVLFEDVVRGKRDEPYSPSPYISSSDYSLSGRETVKLAPHSPYSDEVIPFNSVEVYSL